MKNGNTVSESGDNPLKMWKIQNGTCLATLNGHTDSVYCAIELKNGNFVSESDD